MSADPQAVLVHWALPLLARARRILDDIADRPAPTPSMLDVATQAADDIAALIGHPVTDQPPADELAEILADEPPITEKLVDSARLGTREHFEAVVGRPEVDPVQFAAEQIEQAALAGDLDLATVHPAMAVPDNCDGSMVHYFGPPDHPTAGRFDAGGHPPNCPAYTGPRCGSCGAAVGFGHYVGCPHRPDPLGLRAKGVHSATSGNGESSESATRTGDNADLWRDAAEAYRARVPASDELWRAPR